MAKEGLCASCPGIGLGRSNCHRRQLERLIIAAGRPGSEANVLGPLRGPLIGLFGQNLYHQPPDISLVGDDPHLVGAALDLRWAAPAVWASAAKNDDPAKNSCRPAHRPGALHDGSQLGQLQPHPAGQLPPLGDDRGSRRPARRCPGAPKRPGCARPVSAESKGQRFSGYSVGVAQRPGCSHTLASSSSRGSGRTCPSGFAASRRMRDTPSASTGNPLPQAGHGRCVCSQ